MRELGYKPNNLARSLQGKSAKLIGLIFPNISNVFYAELIDKLEHQLFKNGYKTIICNSEHDSEKEREYIEMLEANQVDGIISGSHNLGIEDRGICPTWLRRASIRRTKAAILVAFAPALQAACQRVMPCSFEAV